MRHFKYLLILFVAFYGVSCRTLRISGSEELNERNYAGRILDAYSVRSGERYLLLRNADLEVDYPEKAKLKAHIYVEQGKRVFVSGKYLGLELFRFELSADSVKFINRLQREFYLGQNKMANSEIVLDALYNLAITGFKENRVVTKKEIEDYYSFRTGMISRSEYFDPGLKLLLNYNQKIKLDSIQVSDVVNEYMLQAKINRRGEEVSEIFGILLYKKNRINWKLIPGSVEYTKYEHTDFRIGRNYQEMDSIL